MNFFQSFRNLSKVPSENLETDWAKKQAGSSRITDMAFLKGFELCLRLENFIEWTDFLPAICIELALVGVISVHSIKFSNHHWHSSKVRSKMRPLWVGCTHVLKCSWKISIFQKYLQDIFEILLQVISNPFQRNLWGLKKICVPLPCRWCLKNIFVSMPCY